MARSDGTGRECWQRAPRDPAPEDLGYEPEEWDVVEARNDGSGHLLFLPADEDVLREEAFVVADSDAVCDLSRRM